MKSLPSDCIGNLLWIIAYSTAIYAVTAVLSCCPHIPQLYMQCLPCCRAVDISNSCICSDCRAVVLSTYPTALYMQCLRCCRHIPQLYMQWLPCCRGVDISHSYICSDCRASVVSTYPTAIYAMTAVLSYVLSTYPTATYIWSDCCAVMLSTYPTAIIICSDCRAVVLSTYPTAIYAVTAVLSCCRAVDP